MKLLIFTQYYWPEDFIITQLAEDLVRKGVEVSVLTGQPNYPTGKIFNGYSAFSFGSENRNGVSIIRMPIIPRCSNLFFLGVNYLSFIVSGIFLPPFLLFGKKFSAIFVYAPSPIFQALPAILCSHLKRVPLIVWVQDLWPDSLEATGQISNIYILNIIKNIVRFIYRCSDLLLIPSRFFHDPVNNLAGGKSNIVYFPNPAPDIFSRPATSSFNSKDESMSGHNFSVVFAGNLGKAQGLAVILDAAYILREYKDIKWLFYGDGSERQWLVKSVEERLLENTTINERVPLEEMSHILTSASALIVTLVDSPVFSYTIPSKVQAYMAAGRPIIASVPGHCGDILIESGAGVAVAPGDPIALSRAVLDLYHSDASTLEKMGAAGRNYYDAHFRQDELSQQLIGYISRLC